MSKSLKQQAYITIRKKIINCNYAPNSFLTEDILCKELNISRTPIRDALGRLEQENLLKIIPKKGVIISSLTISEINMIYETRILLEPYILSTYGFRINDSKEAHLREILGLYNSNLDNIQNIYDLDDEYHQILVDLCENKYLMQCYSNIQTQNIRLRILSGNQNKERLLISQQEHADVSKYILMKDYAKAANALEKHLLSSKEAAFKTISKNGTIDF